MAPQDLGLNLGSLSRHSSSVMYREDVFTPTSETSSFTEGSDPELSESDDSLYIKLPRDRHGLSTKDLHNVRDLLIETAYAAGKIIEAACPTVEAAETKQNSSDLVTEFDRRTEEFVQDKLMSACKWLCHSSMPIASTEIDPAHCRSIVRFLG
ncbi:MAG: hypothetical protein INR71_01545 [Terriglobus roseus]|nr:hypothetical protein [Terriglobus roseus]